MVEESGVKVKVVKRDGQKTFFSSMRFCFCFFTRHLVPALLLPGFFPILFFFLWPGIVVL